MADFLGRFSEAFGVEVEADRNTVRGVIQLAKKFVEGEAEAGELEETIEPVARETEEAAEGFRAHLASLKVIDPQFRTHVEGIIEGYNTVCDHLATMLEQLPDQEQVAPTIEELEAAADRTRDHYRAFSEWNAVGKAVCPVCAFRAEADERRCPSCEVFLTIADPNPPDMPELTLGNDFVAIFNACVQIAGGTRSLDPLLNNLEKVELELQKTVELCNRLEQDEMANVARECLKGLEQMAQFQHTSQLSDLNQGWVHASSCMVALNETLPVLAEAAAAAED